MSTLDLRTVVFMLFLSALLMSGILALCRCHGKGPGLRKWSSGLVLFAAGWLLIATRGAVPPVLSVALADGLLLEGLCFWLAALYEFDGRGVPLRLLLAPGPVLVAAVVPLLEDYALLTLLVSVAYAVVLAAMGRVLLGMRAKVALGLRRATTAILGVGAAVTLVRAAYVWLDAHAGLFTGSLVHVAAFMMLFAVALTSSFAFLALQRAQAEEELVHLAMFDPLTELFNRRAFMELAERAFAAARRGGQPLAVLMVDVDHFKAVNDRHGHQTGDRVLAGLAQRLKSCLRAPDVVGRYGGEEFCAVLPGAGHADAVAAAERIRAAVAAEPIAGIAVTVSAGVASCLHPRQRTVEAVIGRADAALYTAKALGRNRVTALALDKPLEACASARRDGAAAVAPVEGAAAPLEGRRPGELRRSGPG